MRPSASSTVWGTRFQMRLSLVDPTGPPSELAPLSESTMSSVRSSSPVSSRNASRRAIWSSVWDMKAANASM